MGKIAKNYVLNLIYHMFSMFVPLITAPYLARTLGPDGTGIYGYVNSMTTLICTFVMLGIYNYGNRQIAYVRDNKDNLSDTFWQVMSARAVIAVCGTIIYFSITMLLGKYRILFLIYYTYMIGYFIDPTWLFVGVEDMKWALLKNMLTKIIAAIGIFIFIKDENGVPIYLLIQGLSIAVANALSFTQIKRYVKKPHFDFSNVKADIINSALLFLPSVGTAIYTQCDKIMIELMTENSQAVAFYDYSEKLITIPLAFITAISTVMMPRIANEFVNGNKNSIQTLLNKAAKYSMLIAFPVMFGMIAISDKLVPWYLGNNFEPTVWAIKIMAPILLTNTLIGISGSQYFTATNQVKVLVISQFSAAALNILVNAILIPRYSFIGATIATLLTSCVCVCIQYFYLLRQIELSGVFRAGCHYALRAVVMYAIVVLTTYKFPATALTTLVQIVIGGVIYLGISCLMKDLLVKEIVQKVYSLVHH